MTTYRRQPSTAGTPRSPNRTGLLFVLIGIAWIAVTPNADGQRSDTSKPGPAPDVKETIHVRKINVCDEEGNARLRITATESGAEITFVGPTDERQFQISADENGTALSFYDTTGAPRLGMAAGSGHSEVILFGKNRTPTLWLSSSIEKSTSNMGFFDSDGQPRIAVGTSPQDTGVTLYDDKKNIRTVLGTTSRMEKQRPESSLALFDETGKLIWETLPQRD